MLSSKDGLFDKARGRMVGSEDYLTKPFTKDQLLQAVNQHRRGSSADRVADAAPPVDVAAAPTEDPPCPFKRSSGRRLEDLSCSTSPNCSRSAATRCGSPTTATRRCGRLTEETPDLILMDVVMPGLNGFQLTRRITRDPRYANVPVIMCTSKNQETDKVWGMRQGRATTSSSRSIRPS
jgi:DNA-binding response OmpR family regulator